MSLCCTLVTSFFLSHLSKGAAGSLLHVPLRCATFHCTRKVPTSARPPLRPLVPCEHSVFRSHRADGRHVDIGKRPYVCNLTPGLSEATPPAAYRPDQYEARRGCVAANSGVLHWSGRAIFNGRPAYKVIAAAIRLDPNALNANAWPLDCDRFPGTL